MFLFTKYLDVKSPEKTSSLETGFDLFIPNFDNKFQELFAKRNRSEYPGWLFLETSETVSPNVLEDQQFFAGMFPEYIKYIETKLNGELPAGQHLFLNLKKFVIPSGLAISYHPGQYGTINNRSSNFKRDILVQRDICDNSFVEDGHYTQAYNMSGGILHLQPGERISQLCVHKNTNEYQQLKFVEYEEFQQLDEVKNKRLHRTGGFGSSGK